VSHEPGDKVEALLAALHGRRSLLICTHNNPDPDALAAAVGLRLLVTRTQRMRCRIVYGGIIGRAENRTMMKLLRLGAERFRRSLLRPNPAVALVDTQPGARNSPLPDPVIPAVVIDHHRPLRKRTAAAAFADVRVEYGSSSTIVTEYLRGHKIAIPRMVATALLYGIQTDTMGLGRGGLQQDIRAMQYLFPLASLKLLHRIQNPRIPHEHLFAFADAVRQARILRDVLVSHLGPIHSPDVAAEMADFLLRGEGVHWVLVSGVHEGTLHFSLRTSVRGKQAGSLARRIAGRQDAAGGHDRSAGGALRIDEHDTPEALEHGLETRLLHVLGRSGEPHAFRPPGPPARRADRVTPKPAAKTKAEGVGSKTEP